MLLGFIFHLTDSYLIMYVELLKFSFIFDVQLGLDTVPVLIGPLSYLLLSKPAKGVDKSFSLLSLVEKIVPIYK